MEVTTVSPSPTSATEGDDLCETDVTKVAIHSVTLLISLCGLLGNGAILFLLGSHFLSRSSTIFYILILTSFDFLFLLFLLPSTLLFLLEDMSCSVILPLLYVWLLFKVSLVSCAMWLYPLTLISIRRCSSIHCPLWHCCHHPQPLSKVMYALFGAFFITLFFATTLSLCVFQLSVHCWVSFISMYTLNLLFFVSAMGISSTILLMKGKCGSHQQQPKRLDIVVCLTVLFTLPPSLWNFLKELGPIIVPSQMAFLLASIHSSINPFICFLAGRCCRPCSVGSLRLSLQRVFEEPEENTAHSQDPAMDTVL